VELTEEQQAEVLDRLDSWEECDTMTEITDDEESD
jgi:hypothetical protein